VHIIELINKRLKHKFWLSFVHTKNAQKLYKITNYMNVQTPLRISLKNRHPHGQINTNECKMNNKTFYFVLNANNGNYKYKNVDILNSVMLKRS
jgi:hypothetical protein